MTDLHNYRLALTDKSTEYKEENGGLGGGGRKEMPENTLEIHQDKRGTENTVYRKNKYLIRALLVHCLFTCVWKEKFPWL